MQNFKYIIKDQSGKGLLQIFVSVVCMVVVGTMFGTGFQLDGAASMTGGGGFGTINMLNPGNLNLLPIPIGGGGGGSASAAPTPGTQIDGGTKGDTHTVYEVVGSSTVSTDKVKVRALLVDNNKNQVENPFEIKDDDDGGVYKNLGAILRDKDQYYQNFQRQAIPKQKVTVPGDSIYGDGNGKYYYDSPSGQVQVQKDADGSFYYETQVTNYVSAN